MPITDDIPRQVPQKDQWISCLLNATDDPDCLQLFYKIFQIKCISASRSAILTLQKIRCGSSALFWTNIWGSRSRILTLGVVLSVGAGHLQPPTDNRL